MYELLSSQPETGDILQTYKDLVFPFNAKGSLRYPV